MLPTDAAERPAPALSEMFSRNLQSVNEGLPAYIVSALDRRDGGLSGKTVGILGMAFKGESDDPRASLSYKLRKLLQWAGARVVCTDPYVIDDRLTTLDCVLEESDILILGAPHKSYSALPIGGRDVVRDGVHLLVPEVPAGLSRAIRAVLD